MFRFYMEIRRNSKLGSIGGCGPWDDRAVLNRGRCNLGVIIVTLAPVPGFTIKLLDFLRISFARSTIELIKNVGTCRGEGRIEGDADATIYWKLNLIPGGKERVRFYPILLVNSFVGVLSSKLKTEIAWEPDGLCLTLFLSCWPFYGSNPLLREH